MNKIMKKILPLACACAGIILTSCAESVSVAEVLRIPEQAEIYTAYNLWYENPLEISTLNTQKGKLIPFGTQVEIIEADTKSIHFRTLPDRTEFKIVFEQQYRLQNIDDYIRDVFSIKTADDLAGDFSPLVYEKLRRGIVEKGMTKPMVRLAYGPPCAFRTSTEDAKTWVYWTDYLVGKHVVFAKDKVLDIISF